MEFGKAEDIAQNLRHKIVSGELQSGVKINSERDIADEFHVSRMTARRALEILEGEGLITRYPNRGTYVGSMRERVLIDKGREISKPLHTSSVAASELRLSGSFIKDMERIGRKPHILFLEQPSLVAANAEIASNLEIEEGDLVLKRYRLQSADNLPYRIIESYYPADLFGELLMVDIGDKPLFAWLQERHGIRVIHAKENLIARLATQTERQLLKISSTAPIVAVDRTVWGKGNTHRRVEFAHIFATASLYVFTYEYDITEWNKEKKT
jgi:DNA-binding GntR family transcriptional regulator